MRSLRTLVAGLAVLLFPGIALRAEGPKPSSPLRLIPAEADLLLEVPDPGRLARQPGRFPLMAQLQALPVVQEQMRSTAGRRGQQLLAYLEKSLGAKWPELLDRLAGGGVAFAGRVEAANGPVLLVVQGKDERLMKQFVTWAIELIEGELARQESSDRVTTMTHEGVTVHRIGKELRVARLGAALVLSNHKDALARAISLHLGKRSDSLATNEAFRQSRKHLPEAPLATGWLNLKPIQSSPAGKELYKSPRDNYQLTILLGGYIAALGRAPALTAALCEERDGVALRLHAAVDPNQLGPDRNLHLPPAKEDGSRPLLTPAGTIYSSSFYLDVARLWRDREALFPARQVNDLANFDKNSGRVLAGTRLSTLLESAGPYHRLVVANPSARGYKRELRSLYPAFAFVTELRQPETFGKAMNTLLRAAAVASSVQFHLKLAEETYHGHDLVAYRFDETKVVKADVDDVRFNFSPCFARVGNQFLFCSTIELGRELIDLLVAEQASPPKGQPAAVYDRLSSAGFAAFLRDQADSLVMQTILDRAVPPDQARAQVDQFLRLLAGAGSLERQTILDTTGLRFEMRLRLRTK